MSPTFSSTRLSLIDRDIIWVTAHIRGGMERGMKWWKEGKLLNKKNTFEDYIAAAKFLIEKKYTSKGKITTLINQSQYKNWIAGGINNLSLTLVLDYDFIVKNGDLEWINRIDGAYGLIKNQNQDINQLKILDSVAYIRYATVYKNFQGIDNFMKELEILSEDEKQSDKIPVNQISFIDQIDS